MKERDEAPPSFDELEPEGDYSTLEAFPSPNGDRADRVPLEAIEEDYLDDADWFEPALPAPRRLKTRARRAKAQRLKASKPSAQVADWDEEFDAEVEAEGYSDDYDAAYLDTYGDEAFEDDFEDDEDDLGRNEFDDTRLEDTLLPRSVIDFAEPAPGFTRSKCDKRTAGLLEDERLLTALAKRLRQAEPPAERAALVGALVPLALRAHPQVYGALTPLIPSLIRALLAQTARPRTHTHLLSLLQKVVHGLAAKAARGETVSAKHVGRLVAAHTRKATVSKQGS